ncbi:MAG: hypothetical protein LBT98_04335 [Puniceicoccales bacterium]|nr:hypothetical protein [Puniceicoccales bacterium]
MVEKFPQGWDEEKFCWENEERDSGSFVNSWGEKQPKDGFMEKEQDRTWEVSGDDGRGGGLTEQFPPI